MTRGTITVSLHQLRLALATNHERLLTLGRAYLDSLLAEGHGETHIDVTLDWDTVLSPDSRADLEPLGRRLWVGDDRLQHAEIHQVPGLQMEVAWKGSRLVVRATYAWPNRRTKWLASVIPVIEEKVLVSLIYYLVYFPYTWYLEWSAGWTLLHASALATPKGGVILSGLPGCGKSTAALAAIGIPGWQILSDNLLLTDGDQVFAFPEPVHVDAKARNLIGNLAHLVRPTGRHFSHRRQDFEITPNGRRSSTRPLALGFLHLGHETAVAAVPPSSAARRLMANDYLAKEWMAYQETAAAMHQVWPSVGDQQRRQQTIETLTLGIPCFEVTIARDAPIRDEIQQVFRVMLDGT